MTQLDRKIVKQTINKLPLDLINRLLVVADKDCDLFSNNDADCPGRELGPNPEQLSQYLVDSPAKELTAKRKKLINHIIKSNDVKTFNEAKALADSLAKYDNEIESIKQTIKEERAQLKTLNNDRNEVINDLVSELNEALDSSALNKIAQYDAVAEKVAVKSKNKKQMEKGKKEFGKGLIAASIEGVTEEFAAAMEGTTNFTLSFIAKTHARIKEHKEAGRDLNTVAGINTINQNFDREWKIERTNIINKAKLNPDWKKAEAVICQSEEVSEPKLLMSANSEALAIAA